MLLLFGTLICIAQGSFKTDWEKHGLKGKVKSVEDPDDTYLVRVTTYNEKGNITEIALGDEYCYANTKIVYDNKGNITEEYLDNAGGGAGTDSYKTIYVYNEKGKVIQRIGYSVLQTSQNKIDLGGKLGHGNYKESYTYDNAGRLVGREELYINYMGGLQHSKYSYKNDDGGRAVEELVEWPSYNSSVTRNKYKYGGNKIIEISTYEDDVFSTKITYKYDDKGNETEKCTYDKDGNLTSKQTSEYKFDAKGNWTERKTYNWKNGTIEGLDGIETRTIEYYD